MQGLLREALSGFDKTIFVVGQSLLQAEKSASRLSEVVIKVEQEARTRAFARLDGLKA